MQPGVSLYSISELIASFSTINWLYRLGKLFAQSKCSHRNKFDARHSAEYPQSLYSHNVYWMLVQCTCTNGSVSETQECSSKSMKRKSLEHFHLQSSVIIGFFQMPGNKFSIELRNTGFRLTLRKMEFLHRLCIRTLEHFFRNFPALKHNFLCDAWNAKKFSARQSPTTKTFHPKQMRLIVNWQLTMWTVRIQCTQNGPAKCNSVQ